MRRWGVPCNLVPMHCSCCVCRFDRIEAQLSEILDAIQSSAGHETADNKTILQRLKDMANTIDKLRDDFRDNTNLVASRMDRILAQITATSDNTASPETLADLQALSAHLKELGTDPNNPVPALPPA